MASIIVPVGNDRVGLWASRMELNPAITAAAIISGAYIGDTSSYGCTQPAGQGAGPSLM